MASSWAVDRFPTFEAALRRLTEQHRELVDEPLHLAVGYQPATRAPLDVFLFEVIGGAAESINPERDLFEITFGSSVGFPMGPDQELHVVLTYPRELEIALAEGWPLANEVADAIRRGDYRVLFQDEVGAQALTRLQADAARCQEIPRG